MCAKGCYRGSVAVDHAPDVVRHSFTNSHTGNICRSTPFVSSESADCTVRLVPLAAARRVQNTKVISEGTPSLKSLHIAYEGVKFLKEHLKAVMSLTDRISYMRRLFLLQKLSQSIL